MPNNRKDGVVEITVDLHNSGSLPGDETAFLFVSYPDSIARRPEKELKGFQRVYLGAGHTRRVTIPLRVSDLKYWDQTTRQWKVESGRVQILVGPSSTQLSLSDVVMVR